MMGSGFPSKREFLFAKIDVQIKLLLGNPAGTVLPIVQSYSLHPFIQIQCNVFLCLLFCFKFSVNGVFALGFQMREKELGMASYHYPKQMGASVLGFQTREKELGMASYYHPKQMAS